MIEPIFEGVRTRCKNHSFTILGPNESECGKCKLLHRKLGLTPPFDIRCDRAFFNTKKDAIYVVLWVIRDGAKQHTNHMAGYILKDVEGHIIDRIYDPEDFTPVEFLSEEEQEKIRRGETSSD